jgi:hypothetical protein
MHSTGRKASLLHAIKTSGVSLKMLNQVLQVDDQFQLGPKDVSVANGLSTRKLNGATVSEDALMAQLEEALRVLTALHLNVRQLGGDQTKKETYWYRRQKNLKN